RQAARQARRVVAEQQVRAAGRAAAADPGARRAPGRAGGARQPDDPVKVRSAASMSLNKPSETEEEYFAREEAAKLYRTTLEKNRQMAQEERQLLKKLHFMHCPKCGMDLKTIRFRDVSVERCFSCNGTFFDEAELERLAGHDGPGLIERIAAVFKPDKND